jgi:uncharacterized protein (TIGR03083 family)
MWDLIHARRRSVGEMLATLDDQQWNAPSLCAGWRVRDVAAHNVETHLMTPGRFIGQLAGSAFRFHSMTSKGVAHHTTESTGDLLTEFNDTAARFTAPPGPLVAMLGEAVIHGEDMARPLGKKVDAAPEALQTVASWVITSTPLLHGKQRSAGLRLRATDADWTAGDGPEVSGPLASIIIAVTGRTAALDDLAGEGVATLRSRIA